MKGALSIGIVGLPNVGKSTLFSALTKKQVDCANYPFCTIEPNVGVVAVPDKRVDDLVDLTKSAKKIYAAVEFVDIAGLVKGASQGEGLGNQFLANIREVDAVVYVLRLFAKAEVVNTQSVIDPARDKEILDMELALKDLETIQKRLAGLEKDVKAGHKEAKREQAVLLRAQELLSAGKILAEEPWDEEALKILKNYQLLTLKPRLCLLNGEISEAIKGFVEIFQKNNWPHLVLDVLAESEAEDFSREERVALGLAAEGQVEVLIKKSYELLGLITFLTTGEDETRAWTIQRGAKAPQAGGVIHSDFESNFIRAEVIGWQELIEAGGFGKARERGLLRTEGKEYVVKDGDVITIKHGA